MSNVTTIDVSRLPDVLRLAQQVRREKKAVTLKGEGETLAMLMPVASTLDKPIRKAKSKAAYKAFLAAAGSWKGLIDSKRLKKDIYAARGSRRPPVEL